MEIQQIPTSTQEEAISYQNSSLRRALRYAKSVFLGGSVVSSLALAACGSEEVKINPQPEKSITQRCDESFNVLNGSIKSTRDQSDERQANMEVIRLSYSNQPNGNEVAVINNGELETSFQRQEFNWVETYCNPTSYSNKEDAIKALKSENNTYSIVTWKENGVTYMAQYVPKDK